jgi:hypothetical protein
VTPDGGDLAGFVIVEDTGSPTDNILIDGVQVEAAATSSPYVETDGGTATGTGFDDTKLVNQENDYEFEISRTAATGLEEMKLDTSEPSLKYSDDDGATYADDFANYELPPVAQRVLSFRLEPGDNEIVVTDQGANPSIGIEVTALAPMS